MLVYAEEVEVATAVPVAVEAAEELTAVVVREVDSMAVKTVEARGVVGSTAEAEGAWAAAVVPVVAAQVVVPVVASRAEATLVVDWEAAWGA